MNEIGTSQSSPSDRAKKTILPEEPVITIRPNQKRFSLNEILQFHELIYFLIWRDLKVRYKQTLLGVLWVILHPFLMALVFTVFLGQLIRVPSDGIPYPLFVYSGLLVWTFFSNTVSVSSYSLISSSFMITKVHFPHIIIPITTLGVRVVDFFISFLVILVFFIFYGVPPTGNLLFLPVIILQIILITFSFGIFLSVLTVRFRDVGTVLPVVLQIWMFASPIVYPKSLVPPQWLTLYSLNPFVGIIDGFRASLFDVAFEWQNIITSMVFTVVIFVLSLILFVKMDKNLADTL